MYYQCKQIEPWLTACFISMVPFRIGLSLSRKRLCNKFQMIFQIFAVLDVPESRAFIADAILQRDHLKYWNEANKLA